MKYKVGDKVKIKSIDWWGNNKINGRVACKYFDFVSGMDEFCGKTLTIKEVHEGSCCYTLTEDDGLWSWTDEMIEGPASEIEDNKYFEKDKQSNMLSIVLKYLKEEMYIEPVEYSAVSIDEEWSDSEHIIGYRLIMLQKLLILLKHIKLL